MQQEGGRVNQKRRTRAAIVAAAVELLQQGRSPTVAEVADAALVSRTTAYRYFPSQEYLLSEAALTGVHQEVDALLEAIGPDAPAEVRIDTVVRECTACTLQQEGAFRTLLCLSIDQSSDRADGDNELDRLGRGIRRVDWIERALTPWWDGCDEHTRDRLLGGIALCMGIEPVIVLRDICGYPPEKALDICRWVAQVILQAGLH